MRFFGLGFDWRKSKAHWHLLAQFLREHTLDDFARGDRWRLVLKESPSKAVKRFVKEGLVARADLASQLAYRLKATEIKDMLRERGLKVSGRKEDLIARLIEADPAGAKQAAGRLEVFVATEAGRALAEQYVAQERQKREAAELAVMKALEAEDYEEACRVVSAFEEQQVFPRAIPDDQVWVLRSIFSCRPKILAGLRKEAWTPLRMAAAQSALWGTQTSRWAPKNIETGIHLDPATAARMILFWVYNQRQLEILRGFPDPVTAVQIVSIQDGNTCLACRELHGREYRLARVPELPYPNCTSRMGCRCMIAPAAAH